MIWNQIEAIAESISAIAIIVSLVYLAIQIRQNTDQMRSQECATKLSAFERNVEAGNHARELLFLNEELCELSLQGMSSYSSLSPQDQFRFGLLIRNIFSCIQGAYIRHLELSPETRSFSESTRCVDELVANRGIQEWLEVYKPDWRPEFRAFVDERLSRLRSLCLVA